MLYETLLQGKIFLSLIYFGILASIFFEIKFLLLKIFKNNKILNIILEILATLCATIVFWFGILKCNFGIFRTFELVGFCLGILLEYFSVHKILEKNLDLIYNIFGRILNKIKKFKLFKKILK